LADATLRLDADVARQAAFRRVRDLVKEMPHEAAMALVADLAERQLGVPAPPAQVLGWDALRALASDGVTLAPHTRTHPLLARLDASALADELQGSLDD